MAVFSLFISVQLLSRVQLFATPWTAACQASLSFTNPWVYSNSCPLSQWCLPTISSSLIPFSCFLQSFPASGSFPMSQFFFLLVNQNLFSLPLWIICSYFFPFIFISWRLITLQYCSGFCHTLTWGWNRSPAQAGCMRQVLRPGALGRPRGIGWRGRWEGGSGWGIHVNPWLIHTNESVLHIRWPKYWSFSFSISPSNE